jgi:hypothetical protein
MARAARQKSESQQELEIDGKKISISNLDKVLYPKSGFTKAQVIDYYIRASEYLLPHFKNRPVTLRSGWMVPTSSVSEPGVGLSTKPTKRRSLLWEDIGPEANIISTISRSATTKTIS